LDKVMAIFKAEYRANFSDTDAAGIIHFSTIFFWVEATEEALFRHLKLSFLKAEGSKLTGFPRVRVECDYLAPIYREDLVVIELSPRELGDKKIVWNFKAKVGEKEVANGALTTVYAWREGQGPMSAALVPLETKNTLEKFFKA
jgi:acyl-CoA thioesterase FadM